jgi:hypothetical protein
MAPHKFSVRSTAEARTSGRDIAATSRRLRHSNSSFTVSARGLPMSKSLLFAVIAAFLLLGLPILAGDRLPVALAQIAVSFTEWTVPTKGSHPHDPLAAADGSIWYTGQMASTLGRLDPETGVFKEYHTSIPNSGPHGLVADQDGNIWFTASFAGYIGKLDPNTSAISEYRLPDNAHDPHTPVFDRSGNLWFTVIGANAIGRLVPRTGEIKIVHVPTKNALPYGIAVNATEFPISPSSAPTRLRASTRRRWRSANIHCRTRPAGRGASPSRPTVRSGTPTLQAAFSGASIRRRAAHATGLRRAAPAPALTASLRSAT